MATFDYADIADTVAELMDEFGKEVTFIENPTARLDSDKPWNGHDTAGDIPHTLKAVSVPPNTVRQFGITGLSTGTDFKEAGQFQEQVWIVHPGTVDISTLSHAVVDNLRWAVIVTQELKPANTAVLGFVVVRR